MRMLEEDAEPCEVMSGALATAPLVAACSSRAPPPAAAGAAWMMRWWAGLPVVQRQALLVARGLELSMRLRWRGSGWSACLPGVRQSAGSQQPCGADGRPSADGASASGSAVQPCGGRTIAASWQVHGRSTASPAASVEQRQPQAGTAAQPGCGLARIGRAHEAGQEGTQLDSVSIAAAPRLLPPCALQALRAALQARLSQYRRPSPYGAAAELHLHHAVAAGKVRGVAEREAAGARITALQLVTGKRQLLEGFLVVLQPLLPWHPCGIVALSYASNEQGKRLPAGVLAALRLLNAQTYVRGAVAAPCLLINTLAALRMGLRSAARCGHPLLGGQERGVLGERSIFGGEKYPSRVLGC